MPPPPAHLLLSPTHLGEFLPRRGILWCNAATCLPKFTSSIIDPCNSSIIGPIFSWIENPKLNETNEHSTSESSRFCNNICSGNVQICANTGLATFLLTGSTCTFVCLSLIFDCTIQATTYEQLESGNAMECWSFPTVAGRYLEFRMI